LQLCGKVTWDGGLTFQSRVGPSNTLKNSLIKFGYHLTSPVGQIERTTPPWTCDEYAINEDVFELGPMAGGWDAAAWADKGLPTEGNLLLKLQVFDLRP
jgi:hypothetical protein